MKITILISSLHCGGAERVAATLANSWAKNGKSVDIITLSGPDNPPFYPLHDHVTHIPLGLTGPSANILVAILRNFKRIWHIRKAIKQSRPDTLISFMESTNVSALLATAGMHFPVTISEVAVPELQNPGLIWGTLRSLLYKRCSHFVVPSAGVCSYFEKHTGITPRVIPNPVYTGEEYNDKDLSRITPPHQQIIAMGRLSEEKGFDLLLQAFQKVHKHHPEVKLKILGEGPLRERLEEQRKNLGLEQAVLMPGLNPNPVSELKSSYLFVLSSRYEGFGNVICEALAAGLPVVAFNCPTGPAEIIRHGEDGVLINPEDPDALAEAIINLITNPQKRNTMAEKAPEILKRYGIEKVMELWEELLPDSRS